jgi:type II secretory pathway component PulF
MPEFTYTARDATGEKVSGTISADGQREAMLVLAGRSLFPLEIQADSPVIEDRRVRRLPAQLMATTYGQLADLLQSGVPLLRALQVLQQQASHRGLAHVLQKIHRHVEDGATLAEAMRQFPRVFGEMAVSMIRAGGEGGFLEEALSRVAEFTEAQEDLKKRTIGATIYPVILSIFGLIIVTVLLIFFVPKFEELFDNLRERNELPFLTDWLLWTSNKLQHWGIWLLAAAVGAGLYLAVARFCRVLGTLLRNGVPILRSLEIASAAAANRVLAAAIRDATENISAGESLAKPLAESGQFPPTVIEMIAVAEQSNNLENVLLDIADGLERRTWRRLDLGVRLIEPLLLAILASIVLVVVIALLLPVLRMSATI